MCGSAIPFVGGAVSGLFGSILGAAKSPKPTPPPPEPPAPAPPPPPPAPTAEEVEPAARRRARLRRFGGRGSASILQSLRLPLNIPGA